MADKPTKPNWIPDDTSNIIVPSGSKQTTGWLKSERPPFEFFNWFFNLVSQFIDYFSGEAEFNIIIDSDTDEGDYTTLAAYIADSPAAGDRVFLKVDEEITGATMVIPANILLKQQKGKKLWCDENLATVLQFSDGVVTEGDLLLELSHTGTVVNAVSLNGDDNNHTNIIVNNASTGTITSAFEIESAKKGNLAKGEILNPSGTVTTVLTNISADISNDIIIRHSGGSLHGPPYSQHSKTATKNLSDSPAPDATGGGIIWVELRTTGTTEIILDNSIDWRDRFIAINGWGVQLGTSILPGQAGDNGIFAYGNAQDPASLDLVLTRNVIGFLYTEQGGDGSALPYMLMNVEEQGANIGRLYAKSSNGNLAFKFAANPANEQDIILKIDYSPIQNHY